ncbi:MAG: hypothetical protein HC778_05475 [Chamaesiphon sp. CSU_1_12]|nr:hypothetical protein [Chamaesiphon sp. CSU_1_12]
MQVNLAYYLKCLHLKASLLIRAILCCGFIGQIIVVKAIANPSRTSGEASAIDARSVKIVQVKAIVNNVPERQISIRGELDVQKQPVRLEQWLLPFDATLKLLDIQQNSYRMVN